MRQSRVIKLIAIYILPFIIHFNILSQGNNNISSLIASCVSQEFPIGFKKEKILVRYSLLALNKDGRYAELRTLYPAQDFISLCLSLNLQSLESKIKTEVKVYEDENTAVIETNKFYIRFLPSENWKIFYYSNKLFFFKFWKDILDGNNFDLLYLVEDKSSDRKEAFYLIKTQCNENDWEIEFSNNLSTLKESEEELSIVRNLIMMVNERIRKQETFTEISFHYLLKENKCKQLKLRKDKIRGPLGYTTALIGENTLISFYCGSINRVKRSNDINDDEFILSMEVKNDLLEHFFEPFFLGIYKGKILFGPLTDSTGENHILFYHFANDGDLEKTMGIYCR